MTRGYDVLVKSKWRNKIFKEFLVADNLKHASHIASIRYTPNKWDIQKITVRRK